MLHGARASFFDFLVASDGERPTDSVLVLVRSGCGACGAMQVDTADDALEARRSAIRALVRAGPEPSRGPKTAWKGVLHGVSTFETPFKQCSKRRNDNGFCVFGIYGPNRFGSRECTWTTTESRVFWSAVFF